jgi:hypothetical protein
MSSPERFEIKQLIASGAVSAADVSIAMSSRGAADIFSTPTWTMILQQIPQTPR